MSELEKFLVSKFNDRAYIVGGAIRDEFFGITPKDKDYAVACSFEEFIEKVPHATMTGKDFPVFRLDDCEVALTRTEKCIDVAKQQYELTGVGVPIENDLMRRDFTINSMAKRLSTGQLIDIANGVAACIDRKLVATNALSFQDDPIRIYRGLRFASKLNLRISSATNTMMMQSGPLLDFMKPERVLVELEKVYRDLNTPSAFFDNLSARLLLKYHFAPLEACAKVMAGVNKRHGGRSAYQHTMNATDVCKSEGLNFDCFIAVLCHDFGKGTTPAEILPNHYKHEERSLEIATDWFKQHRFSARTQKLAKIVAAEHMRIHKLVDLKPSKVIDFVSRIPRDLKEDFLDCCNCDFELTEEQVNLWRDAEKAILTTEIKLPEGIPKEAIPNYVLQKRTERLKEIRKERLCGQ